jgi:hypothetical protein
MEHLIIVILHLSDVIRYLKTFITKKTDNIEELFTADQGKEI